MRFILFFLLLLPNLALMAAEPNMRFERLSIDEGLSQSVGLSIGQDGEGFMWFGTYDGLNRYDGYQFKLFRHDPANETSLSNNAVTVIYKDSLGTLWVGTEGGLNRYDKNTQRFVRYTHDPENSNSLSHNAVSSLGEDDQGRLWVGTLGGGVNRFDAATGQFVHFKSDNSVSSLSNNNVNAIYKDQSGKLWVGTDFGLNEYLSDSDGFRRIHHDKNNPLSLSHDNIHEIFQDRSGVLWIGTFGGGLNRFDSGNSRFEHFRHDPQNPKSLVNDFIWSISEDEEGALWIGTEAGLSKLNAQRSQFRRLLHQMADPYSLSNDIVRDVFRDKRGLMWLGTFGGGINRVDIRQKRLGLYKHVASEPSSLSQNIIFSLHQDADKNLWVGTFGGGLNRQDNTTREMQHFMNDPNNPDSLGDNFIWTMYEDSEGIIWLGTRNGPYRFDKKTGKFSAVEYPNSSEVSSAPQSITAILKDRDSVMWLGTWGEGLMRLDSAKGTFERFRHDQSDKHSLSNDIILAMREDNDGNIWIATNDGITIYQRAQKQFVRYQHDPNNPNSLTQGFATSIYQDKQGDIWVGTSAGLNKWLPHENGFKHYNESDGLPNDVIYCITEDNQGLLWMSTNQGLSAFNRLQGTFKNYDLSYGLQSNEFNHNACKTGPDGELFFAGVKGFNRFFPQDIIESSEPPKVVFTDFLLSNQTVPIDVQNGSDTEQFVLTKAINQLTDINLGYKQNLVSFEFAALDFHSPMKNHYQYQLEGYDEQWLNADPKIRLATYTNLPSGDYKLMVRGTNAEGVWSEQGASIKLHVSPPPWLSWWAITLYVLSTVITISYIAYFFGQRKNERRVIEQLRALDKLKDDFLAKMSHEIRTPMNAVVGLSRLALNAKTDQERREHISTVLDSGDALLELINDILDFSKIKAAQMSIEKTELDLCDVLTQTFNQCALRAHEQGLSLAVVTENSIPSGLMGDPLRIRQVLVNLVNNAVKFTETGGVWIKIRFEREEDGRLMLHCSVNDSGCGMNKTQQARLFKSYAQADTSVSRTHGGTGLGLAIAKQLCELMGGRIWVESEPDKGSSFFFTVELFHHEDALVVEQPFSGFRALVIDDVDFCNEAMVSQLCAFGIKAQGVANVEAAILKIDEAEQMQMPFNLVVTDWTVPGLNNIQERLTQLGHDTLIMHTVGRYDKERFRKEVLGAAKLNVIDKPVLPHILYRSIGQLRSGEVLENHRNGPASLQVPDLSKYNILLVDDNAINRQVAVGFLEYTKADVDVAENGLIALDKLKNSQYHLILMDIDMPKMDGITATREIRKSLGLTELPILAITGYATQGDSKRFGDEGMQGHITKPFEQEALYRAIGEHLDHEDMTVTMGLGHELVAEVPDFAEKIGSIDGLDVHKAVSRLSGHEGLYYELLTRFQRHERTQLNRLENAYKNKDWRALERGAHSLKSMAAFIGAEEIASLANTLEYKLSQGEQDNAIFTRMCGLLAGLLDALDQALVNEEPQPQVEFNLQRFIGQLNALIELLKNTDFDSEALLEKMKLHCVSTPYLDTINQMIVLVDDVEFEQAALEAEKMLAHCIEEAEAEALQ